MYQQEAFAAGPAREREASDLAGSVELAVRIAQLGHGEAVIEMALLRQGRQGEDARLIAATVRACQSLSRPAHPVVARQHPSIRQLERQGARVAELMLSKLLSFVMFFVVGIGGGAMLGWGAGFDSGVEEGARWVFAAVAQLAQY